MVDEGGDHYEDEPIDMTHHVQDETGFFFEEDLGGMVGGVQPAAVLPR